MIAPAFLSRLLVFVSRSLYLLDLSNISFPTPNLPGTPYDNVDSKQRHPPPGAKFKAFKDMSFTSWEWEA